MPHALPCLLQWDCVLACWITALHRVASYVAQCPVLLQATNGNASLGIARTIHICASVENSQIEIVDNGMGMDPETIKSWATLGDSRNSKMMRLNPSRAAQPRALTGELSRSVAYTVEMTSTQSMLYSH